MKRNTLHELAKFASGLVAGDFLALWWISAQGILPMNLLGVTVTNDLVLPGLVFDAALFIILVHYGWHIGKTPTLRGHTYFTASGVVFGVVAVAHLLRAFTGAELNVAGWQVPTFLSWIGTAGAAYLSYMSFHLAVKMK